MATPALLSNRIENGTIGAPYRPPLMQQLGLLADAVNTYAKHAEKVGFTVPQWSPMLAGSNINLKDFTVGDLGRVLENISYGMPPTNGGNYATGGLGTLGQVDRSAIELVNVLPFFGLAGKGLQRAGKVLTLKE